MLRLLTYEALIDGVFIKVKKKKVLFYCQHLLGIGHISRSLAICNELVKSFEVHFVQGGPFVNKTIDHPNFHHHYIQPLLMHEHNSELYDPNDENTLVEIWSLRETELKKILNYSFEHIFIELFPFGRNKFRFEIFSLIDQAKTINPKALVHCSSRDIMVEKKDKDKRNKKIVNYINQYFDTIFVHSDSQLVKLDETFSRAIDIKEKTLYTGYITQAKVSNVVFKREKLILISMGGGVVGDELLLALSDLPIHYKKYTCHFILGPYSKPALKEKLELKAIEHQNMKLTGFIENFEEVMAKSSLSISLAGYNTVMNLLNTKTKAIVYPYMANIEQNMRAVKLEQLGFLSILRDNDFETTRLKTIIDKTLAMDYPQSEINLKGAEFCRNYLENL